MTAAVEETRDVWGKQLEFIFTLVGYAVGLGNVWRFPYLCFKNGGGAFLIPYVVCLVLLGIPMFALECAFGQYGGKGPLSIWSINPLFKGLGISMVLISAIIFIYYNVVIAQAVRFFVASWTSDLPWLDCNSCDCLLYNTKYNRSEIEFMKYNNSLGVDCQSAWVRNWMRGLTEVGNNNKPTWLPLPPPSFSLTVCGKHFITGTDDILDETDSIKNIGDVRWELLVCNLVVFLIVFLVLVKGIASLGKMSYFTATFPYILLTVILVRVAMLDGARKGVEYYLKPDWDQLTKASVWSDAATQIFFSLSCCQGGLVAMASYNKFDNNILRDAFLVPIINCLTSFYAGFVVFCTLGYMSDLKDVPINNVTEQGTGLVFIVYPEAIGAMPVSTLWAVLFFFMLSVLGFSSQFSIAETIMTAIADEFRWFFGGSRAKEAVMRFIVVMLGFVLGIPLCTQGGQHLQTLVDEAVLGFPMLIVGFMELILISHIYGYKKFAQDIKIMVGFSPFVYFKIAWVVVSPVVLLALIVFKAYDMEDFDPAWEGLLYYLIIVFDLMWIPIGFLFFGRHALKKAMAPQEYWHQRRRLGKNAQAMDASHMENGGSAVEMESKDGVDSYDNKGYVSEEGAKTRI